MGWGEPHRHAVPWLTVTLSPAARRMLKRNGELHVVLTTRFTPTGGTTRQSSRTVRIRINARGAWVVTDVTGRG